MQGGSSRNWHARGWLQWLRQQRIAGSRVTSASVQQDGLPKLDKLESGTQSVPEMLQLPRHAHDYGSMVASGAHLTVMCFGTTMAPAVLPAV